MKKSLIVFSIVFVLMFSMAASVLGTKVLSQKQITQGGEINDFPAIHGNYIVWQNSEEYGNRNIWGYDIQAKKIFQITFDDDNDQRDSDIYGDIVVWVQSNEIWGKSINGGSPFQISETGDYADYPAIYGNTVVWQNSGDPGSILGRKVTSTGTAGDIFVIRDDEYSPEYPDIYGDIVVWQENNEIWGKSINSGTPFRISDEYKGANYPAIYENIVVWTEDSKIFVRYITSSGVAGSHFVISDPGKNSEYPPAIYGDIVVWEQYDGITGSDIWGYNLKTKQLFQISNNGSCQNPVVFCGYVTWDDGSQDGYEIFLANLDVVCETAKKPLPMDWIMKKFGLGKFKNN